VKTAREQLDILTTYAELGSYRATAALTGTTHKTVRRVVERRSRPDVERPPRPKTTDPYLELVAAKVKATDGRISAKRLLPLCQTAGYTGSARSLRRAVAEAKAEHRRARRVYRPWAPIPGEHLVFDWGEEGESKVFCAVLAWSRWRFVRFAERQDQATTLALLAECLELLGGIPGILLTDRMGCLKGGVVANVVVPAPGYVAFAAHYGFRVDFCEAGDPESKGVVEHLVGYAKSDLLIGLGPFSDLGQANTTAAAWCAEVNARVHSEISAVPDERLATERTLLGSLPGLRPTIGPVETRIVDTLRTVRFHSARYSLPGAFIGKRVGLRIEGPELVIEHRDAEITRHRLVGPGEMSLVDAHYGGPAGRPARAVRPRTPAELAFLDLGPVAEAFVRAAAAAGTTKLPTELGIIVELERAHGREALVAALERALAHRRFRAADVRSILTAGAGVSRPRAAGAQLATEVPSVPVRSLAAYAIEGTRCAPGQRQSSILIWRPASNV
jgi:transposase